MTVSFTHRKAESIMHPVRMRLLMTLAGREMTPQQLGETLPDVSKASLYRHINALCEVNALRVVRETPVRGAVEKVYAVNPVGATLNAQELANVTPEDHLRYFTAYVSSLLAQFRNSVEHHHAHPEAGNFAFNTEPFHLTEAEFAQMAEELNAVLGKWMAVPPVLGRRRRLLSLIVTSDAEEQT